MKKVQGKNVRKANRKNGEKDAEDGIGVIGERSENKTNQLLCLA